MHKRIVKLPFFCVLDQYNFSVLLLIGLLFGIFVVPNGICMLSKFCVIVKFCTLLPKNSKLTYKDCLSNMAMLTLVYLLM